MSIQSPDTSRYVGSEIIVPEAPTGLTPEILAPLVEDSDPVKAAYARYLLVLLGQPEHLDRLIDYWRTQQRADADWIRLVYRAIAASNDATKVPVLDEIYSLLDKYSLQEFYWTIRIMEGPEILKLRKRIRSEAGMEALR